MSMSRKIKGRFVVSSGSNVPERVVVSFPIHIHISLVVLFCQFCLDIFFGHSGLSCLIKYPWSTSLAAMFPLSRKSIYIFLLCPAQQISLAIMVFWLCPVYQISLVVGSLCLL